MNEQTHAPSKPACGKPTLLEHSINGMPKGACYFLLCESV